MENIGTQYRENGFISGLPIISTAEANLQLKALTAAEQAVGNLHYFNKMHLFLDEPMKLARHRQVLDIVQQCIGKDILLYNCTYIIKEPQTDSFVSWHQDLTYWGLSDDAQVSMWLALTEADESNGCMRMLPESHKHGMRAHTPTDDKNNVLDLGQTVQGIDESTAVVCALKAGEASFHHGWTLHASAPNKSDKRRVGLNVQYLAPHVKQLNQPEDSALLVRGEDNHHFYETDKVISTQIAKSSLPEIQAYRDKFVETYKKANP